MLQSWAYASALPRSSKGFPPNLDARRLFLGKCRRDAEAAAQRPEAARRGPGCDHGRGSHERGDLADAPEMVVPQARPRAWSLERAATVAAADVVDPAPAMRTQRTN